MRHTKYDSLSGRKAVRASELDLPSKEEMRRVGKWLARQGDSTELPKHVNIEERKRKNRARAKAAERSLRWKQRNREKWASKMREYRKRWKELKASQCA